MVVAVVSSLTNEVKGNQLANSLSMVDSRSLFLFSGRPWVKLDRELAVFCGVSQIMFEMSSWCRVNTWIGSTLRAENAYR